MESPQDNETMPLTNGFNFTPIFRGQRVRMRVDPEAAHRAATRGTGLRCLVEDLDTGTVYRVYGRPCGFISCNCDAEICERGAPLPWHDGRAELARGGAAGMPARAPHGPQDATTGRG